MASETTTGWRRFLAKSEAKRATELVWLKYTPVWGAIAGLVMLTGLAEGWGDTELMILGVGLALGAVAGPLLFVPESQHTLPWWQRTGFKMVLSVVGLSFGYNYLQTPFFWDVLHMHYGFDVTVTIQNNPVFLYFMTIPYFATYAVLTCMAFRLCRHLLGAHVAVSWIPWVLAPIAVAFLETALNANPFMTSLFCYDDMQLMLWFGTLCYALAFVFALPMWMGIDEDTPTRVPSATVVVWILAVLAADHLTLELIRYHVAPQLTVVETGANGLRDFEDSCLVGDGS